MRGVMPKLRFVAAMSFTAAAISGCGEPYREEATRYHAVAQEVLVAKGVCSSAQECQRKQLLFWEGGGFSLGFVRWGGAYVNLYETQDPVLVEAVVARLKEAHVRPSEPQVILTVYSSKHLQPKVMFREVVIK